MPTHPEYSILYQEPDIISLRKSGFQVVDMHLHTCHSDGLTRVSDLITYAKARQIGVAITDHNEISGVLKAVTCHEDTMIIPGIELET
jgi:predicted metal-dependent phosphoesterase TrpH